MKFILILFTLLLAVSCRNTNTKNRENIPQESVSRVTYDNSFMDSLGKVKLAYSEINWNYYIEKGSFEQSSPDSSLLILVQPDFAIFVFGDDDMDSGQLSDYQITFFKKHNGNWERQEISSNIPVGDAIGNFGGNYWRLEDINGDNYKDILLKTNQDEEQNKKYVCLLQDPKNKTFTKLEWFSNVINPKYDSVTKTLKSSVSNKKIITENSFHWINDTIKLIN